MLLGIASTVIAVAGFRTGADIIAPIILALVLVIAAHPVLASARAHGAPQWLAVSLALLVRYTIVIGLAVTLGISVARLAALLPQYRDEIDGSLGDVRSLLTSAGVGREQVPSSGACWLFLLALLLVVAAVVSAELWHSRPTAPAGPAVPGCGPAGPVEAVGTKHVRRPRDDQEPGP